MRQSAWTGAAPATLRDSANRGRFRIVDFYDAIEWAAAQPWCNGNVGLSGISYYAINQWFVANLNPPSLKAIIPWEGFADLYRDALFHGGLLSLFMTELVSRISAPYDRPRIAAIPTAGRRTLCIFGYPQSGQRRFPRLAGRLGEDQGTVFSVGNWTGFGLHLRGNMEGFARAAQHKKLRMHAGTTCIPSIRTEGRRDQLRFFDYWLKGVDNGVMDEPPVKLAIRKGRDAFEWRYENEWPIARTQWTKLYFDLSEAPAGQSDADRQAGRRKSGEVRPRRPMPRPASARWARPRPRPRR